MNLLSSYERARSLREVCRSRRTSEVGEGATVYSNRVVRKFAASLKHSTMLQDLSRKGHQSATCSHLHHTEGRSHSWQHRQNVRVLSIASLEYAAWLQQSRILLCRQLHRDSRVNFAGYKVPHPLEYRMLVKVLIATFKNSSCNNFSKHGKQIRSAGQQLNPADAAGANKWRV